MLLIALTPLIIEATRSPIDYPALRRVNQGLGPRCEFDIAFVPKAECRTSAAPNLMVWGDSFAMHLVPGLQADWQNGGLIQATKSGCGPLLGLAPRRLVNESHGLVYDREWSNGCNKFNRSVIEYLRQNESIQTVVISSLFTAYLDGAAWHMVMDQGSGIDDGPASGALALGALTETVKTLHSIGKKVVLIAPPPTATFNVGGCLERALTGRVVLGAAKGCQISAKEYQARRSDVINLLDSAEQAGLPLIRFDAYLCDKAVCQTQLAGTMIYRDGGHLSHAGSALLARRMHLGQQIARLAQ